MKVNVLDIIKGTTVDGPGFRTSVYLAGCTHNCPGCHNPQSHDFYAGTPMEIDEILAIIKEEDFDVTLSGGDPLMHPEAVSEIARGVHSLGHTIWVYTGYTLEEILQSEHIRNALSEVDAIVDGPFVESLKDPDLLFRGSSNQRIIQISDIPEICKK